MIVLDSAIVIEDITICKKGGAYYVDFPSDDYRRKKHIPLMIMLKRMHDYIINFIITVYRFSVQDNCTEMRIMIDRTEAKEDFNTTLEDYIIYEDGKLIDFEEQWVQKNRKIYTDGSKKQAMVLTTRQKSEITDQVYKMFQSENLSMIDFSDCIKKMGINYRDYGCSKASKFLEMYFLDQFDVFNSGTVKMISVKRHNNKQ